MRVKTAETYRRRFAARGQKAAPKTRLTDYVHNDYRALLGMAGVTVDVAWKSKPNHSDRVVTLGEAFPQPMGEEMWLV